MLRTRSKSVLLIRSSTTVKCELCGTTEGLIKPRSVMSASLCEETYSSSLSHVKVYKFNSTGHSPIASHFLIDENTSDFSLKMYSQQYFGTLSKNVTKVAGPPIDTSGIEKHVEPGAKLWYIFFSFLLGLKHGSFSHKMHGSQLCAGLMPSNLILQTAF